jgi:hypothetical protein
VGAEEVGWRELQLRVRAAAALTAVPASSVLEEEPIQM